MNPMDSAPATTAEQPNGSLYAPPGSAAAELARGIAWLWRLGPVLKAPAAGTIGLGTESEAAALVDLVGEGRLAGAIVMAAEEGGAVGVLPARTRISGRARFEGPSTVLGEFTILDGPGDRVSSSLGAHALRRDDVLFVGLDPVEGWGRLDSFWAYEAIAEFISQRIAAPLVKLPPVGCMRLDDSPGMALHQLQGRDKTDRRQRRRLRKLAGRLERSGAVLNMAVVAEALEDGRRVPLEQVWPDSVRVIREGIERGAFEPVLHGLLHLQPAAFERGEVEFTEFAHLDAATAGEHLDRALAWQSEHLATPRNFCAPAWAYGPASDQEAAARGLVRWYRARPGPLLEDGRLYESVIGELYGLDRLDYSPVERLAAVGIPPMVAMHGALLDARLQNLRGRRDWVSLARLFFVRDVTRLMRLDGVRWIGADELINILADHAETERPAAVR